MSPRTGITSRLRPALGLPILLLVAGAPRSARAQEGQVDLHSEQWQILNGQVEEFDGRTTLAGSALLPAVDFHNGVLEVDMYFEGDRCFAGFYFRVQSGLEFENVYLRPHKSGEYDALQYQGVFGGQSSWQLYSGEGYTAAVEIPHHAWVHVKMEIMGSQARIFVGGAPEPALVINDLKHGDSHGPIGLQGTPDRLARFAGFSWRSDDNLRFDPPPPVETPEGAIMDWELSRAYPISTLDRDRYPLDQIPGEPEWRTVRSEPSGILNIARYVPRNGQQTDCVLARTVIRSDAAASKKLLFGYSDEVSIFLNGRILFRGDNSFRRRDPAFTGLVGLFDAAYLELGPGDNELILAVSENSGGWGLIARLTEPGEILVELHPDVEPLWTATGGLTVPESVLFDPGRNVFYVSNYVPRQGYVSRLSPDGTVLDAHWVDGIGSATGMGLWRDRLFVAGLTSVFEIDIESGEIAAEHAIEGARFLNDIVIDPRGTLYVTDSQADCIFTLRRGRSEIWLEHELLDDANGLCLDGGRLLAGNAANGAFFAIDLATREVREIVRLGEGIIVDGIRIYDEGRYLISDWSGITYLVTLDGELTPLIHTRRANQNQADFEYLPQQRLLLIPTFGSNSVAAYRVNVR